MSEKLPQRSATELAVALRERASRLSGQNWELPATIAMMKEAAGALEQSERYRAALSTIAAQNYEIPRDIANAALRGRADDAAD